MGGKCTLVAYKLCNEFLDFDDIYFRPRDCFQNIEMSIISDNKLCICCYSTINKLIVILVCLNQSKMYVNFLKDCCTKPCNCFNNVDSNLFGRLFCKNLFVLVEYLRVDT